MFKLLTEEHGQKVEHEYYVRRIIAVLGSLIMVLVLSIIGLLPSYLLSENRQLEVEDHVATLSGEGLMGDEDYLKGWLDKTNQRLDVMAPSLDVDRPSNFVTEVLDRKTDGIRITGFSWSKESQVKVKVKGRTSLSVAGIAENRQALILFRDSVDISEKFSDIILPISDLAQDKDIVFQITFYPTGAFLSEKSQ
jgi:hypothetical protein